MSDIAKQLLELRKELELTQRELADRVGIDQTMISDYEAGRFIPSLKTIKKFAKQGIIIDVGSGQVTQVKDFEYKGEEMTNAAKEIIKIREDLGLNQSSFARRIGVSPTTLCEIESGKRQLTTTTLRKIKEKTGISLIPSTTTISSQTQEVKTMQVGKIIFNFVIAGKTFELLYSNCVEEKATRTYILILNREFFDFIKFLSIHYPSQVRNMKVDNGEKVLLLISHNTTNYFYALQIKGDSFTRVVTFKPTNFEDISEKPDTKEEPIMQTVEDKPLIPIPKSLQKEESNSERDILILCQNIIQIRDLLDKTLELAEKVIQPIVDKEKEVEVKKERQIVEVVHKVYKQEIDSTNRIYVGTRTLTNEIIFRVASESEKLAKESWKIYQYTFSYQTETHYNDGTVDLGDKMVFTPANKIQEIESSDRKGVIGYVEHKAGIVEVIYYDRFVN